VQWIALKMLLGNRPKFYAIVFGISFACMLMTQQLSIFVGLMRNTSSQIRDIQGADIWVMDPSVQFIEDVTPRAEIDLYRVRSVPGVKWAVRLYKSQATAQLEKGNFKTFSLIGLDDQTLVGAPAEMLPAREPDGQMRKGEVGDLRWTDGFILDERGHQFLFPGQPLHTGWTVELNDRRAVCVGICKSSPSFQTFPICYTLYSRALLYAPQERRTMSFILAKGDDGVPTQKICDRIAKDTGLMALTQDGFSWRTIGYYMSRTGIPINFGITVALGFIIGAAIAGQTFYLFTLDNLKQFGALKAMGVSNWSIIRMVLLQGLVVGALGYAIGIGMASVTEEIIARTVKGIPPAMYMVWWIPLTSAGAASLIVIGSALLSLSRVIRLEPASVFR
jgi:putative ABC transport system permease protein